MVAVVLARDPRFDLLASCLTATWKLVPVELLESLGSHRAVTLGEFYTILYDNDDAAPDREPLRVTVIDGENEIVLAFPFFAAVVGALGRAHLAAAGEAHFPWLARLTPTARAIVV